MTQSLLSEPMARKKKSAPAEDQEASKKTSLKVSQDFLRMLNAVCNFLGVEQGRFVETELKGFIRGHYERMIREESERLRKQ